MSQVAFTDMVQGLTGSETPRIWSLLVTVFGELAQGPEASIGGAVLGRLVDPIGIKPEATRVALHRLRKDGWIESQRLGRKSAYSLTDWGRTQSAEASPIIYAMAPQADAAWLVLTNPSVPADGARAGGAWITSNMRLSLGPSEVAEHFSSKIDPGMHLPDWMRNRVCDAELVDQSVVLAARLSHLRTQGAAFAERTPTQIATLRILIVHSWRRIILKAPQLPEFVYPRGWHGAECRKLVNDLLAALPKPTLPELSQEIAG